MLAAFAGSAITSSTPMRYSRAGFSWAASGAAITATAPAMNARRVVIAQRLYQHLPRPVCRGQPDEHDYGGGEIAFRPGPLLRHPRLGLEPGLGLDPIGDEAKGEIDPRGNDDQVVEVA